MFFDPMRRTLRAMAPIDDETPQEPQDQPGPDQADKSPSPPVHQFKLAVAPVPAGDARRKATGEDWDLHRGEDGQWIVQVTRAAPSFHEALLTAIREVVASGLVVRRVEPDDLVTQAEIAERLGRTSESIRLLSRGQRGKGTFPPPAARTTVRGSLWRWSEVAVWAKRPTDEVARTELIAIVNVELQRFAYGTRARAWMVDEVEDAIRSAVHRPPAPAPAHGDSLREPSYCAEPGDAASIDPPPEDDSDPNPRPPSPAWVEEDEPEDSFAWI
jgi:hypothetical protein